MEADPKKPRPERDRTDESLRTERKNTDAAMAERRKGVEEIADDLLEKAREEADAVLDTARDKADRGLEASGARARGRTAVAGERAAADEILEEERLAADARLVDERAETRAALAALLPLERRKTDRYLLTERVRSDDALAQRDDFMGMVSHDLRNLLSGIVVQTALVAAGAPASDEGRRTVAATERIQRYVARMNRLIGDLVDVVSIDAGKLAIHPTPGDAATLLAEAVETFLHAAAEQGVSLGFETAESPLPASFDHDRMLQVLANLIANALKFTPRGGAIALRGERVGESLRLSVTDTGEGIPADLLEAVFQRFWQVGANDSRGLGLGLYISRCIVEAHGGRIWAESELGAGSAFHILIPLS
jgi:signal transduction histidine kinase